MRTVFVGGPAASGKTSILRTILPRIMSGGDQVKVVKFDCISGSDEEMYKDFSVAVQISLSGDICPDHHLMINFGEMWLDALEERVDLLVVETAGLCERCSPFLERVPAVCVLPLTTSINGPQKMKSLVAESDLIILTKGELVSQAEREVFKGVLRSLNTGAAIYEINGLTGEGGTSLLGFLQSLEELDLQEQELLRFSLPRGACSHCSGGLR